MIDCQKMCRTLEGAQAIVRTMMDNQEENITQMCIRDRPCAHSRRCIHYSRI